MKKVSLIISFLFTIEITLFVVAGIYLSLFLEEGIGWLGFLISLILGLVIAVITGNKIKELAVDQYKEELKDKIQNLKEIK